MNFKFTKSKVIGCFILLIIFLFTYLYLSVLPYFGVSSFSECDDIWSGPTRDGMDNLIIDFCENKFSHVFSNLFLPGIIFVIFSYLIWSLIQKK